MIDLNTLSLPALFDALTADGSLRRLLELARDEDLGPSGVPGDLTAQVSVAADDCAVACVVARRDGVLAGAAAIPELLRVFAPNVIAHVHLADGSVLAKGDTIAKLSGNLRQILGVERTLLNLIGRLSGIATRTTQFVAEVRHTRVKLLDTRKTTPGLRAMEKYAVRCGGGHCHRMGLFDAVLIKDNHIAAVPLDELADRVARASTTARELAKTVGGIRFVELEVDRLQQLERILSSGGCGVDIVLLDNMPVAVMKQAVALRDRLAPGVLLEASGGVSLDTIRAIAEAGVDRISVGGLTHQATSLDVALDIGPS